MSMPDRPNRPETPGNSTVATKVVQPPPANTKQNLAPDPKVEALYKAVAIIGLLCSLGSGLACILAIAGYIPFVAFIIGLAVLLPSIVIWAVGYVGPINRETSQTPFGQIYTQVMSKH